MPGVARESMDPARSVHQALSHSCAGQYVNDIRITEAFPGTIDPTRPEPRLWERAFQSGSI